MSEIADKITIKNLDNSLKDNASTIRHLITKKGNLKPYKSKSKLKSN